MTPHAARAHSRRRRAIDPRHASRARPAVRTRPRKPATAATPRPPPGSDCAAASTRRPRELGCGRRQHRGSAPPDRTRQGDQADEHLVRSSTAEMSRRGRSGARLRHVAAQRRRLAATQASGAARHGHERRRTTRRDSRSLHRRAVRPAERSPSTGPAAAATAAGGVLGPPTVTPIARPSATRA